MKCKKLISYILLWIICLQSFDLTFASDEVKVGYNEQVLSPSAVTDANESGVSLYSTVAEVGAYYQMGTYRGKPILWRCVDIDENGPLMLSDKVLCYKAFDGAGSVESGSHGRGPTGIIEKILPNTSTRISVANKYRAEYGSNYWGDSNIRDWLNSDAEEGKVVWSCGNAPNDYSMWYHRDGYETEAGFLNDFTPSECSAIRVVTQKQLLDGREYSNTPNEDRHIYNRDIENFLQNYDNAYSETTTDKIFLLDIKQLYNVYKTFGKDICIVYATEEAKGNSHYGTSTIWLLRSPADIDPMNSYYKEPGVHVRCVSWTASANRGLLVYVDRAKAYQPDYGIRPAFYLNLSSAIIKGGNGTEISPYVLDGDGNGYIEPVNPTTKGDLNEDGKITAVDAMITAQLASGKRVDTKLWAKADVNGDSNVTAVDAMLIARYASGKITSF